MGSELESWGKMAKGQGPETAGATDVPGTAGKRRMLEKSHRSLTSSVPISHK